MGSLGPSVEIDVDHKGETPTRPFPESSDHLNAEAGERGGWLHLAAALGSEPEPVPLADPVRHGAAAL